MTRADWYTVVINEGVDLNAPGIYRWEIEGAGSYIGIYTHQRRPLREYELNVRKIIEGRPYRKHNPDGFRKVHRALELARREGRSVRLVIVENCAVDKLADRERELIALEGDLNITRPRQAKAGPSPAPADAFTRIVEAEAKLRNWTLYAIDGLSCYASANRALGVCGSTGDVAQLAAWYRGDVALMTAIRVHALFDRAAEVSFQQVHRDLQINGVIDLLAQHYQTDGKGGPRFPARECLDAIKRFETAYATIDFKVFGSLQHFRNRSIAHINWKDAERFISYDDLGVFVRLACELSSALSLAVHGQNSDRTQRLDDQIELLTGYWCDAMRAERQFQQAEPRSVPQATMTDDQT